MSSLIEGWHRGDYLILFDEAERSTFSARYDIAKYLAGYFVAGLRGWDELIVCGADGRYATVPAVPIRPEHLKPIDLAIDAAQVVSDDRFRGKVKWCLKPLILGGDPADDDNMVWVSLDQHADLVKWWNDRHRAFEKHAG